MSGLDFSSLKAIIFDMDGVLIDSEPIHNFATQKALAGLGIEMREEEIHQFIGIGANTMYDMLRENQNLAASREEFFAAGDKAIEEAFKDGYPEVKGAKQLLEKARSRGFKIALATGSSKQMIDDVLDRLQIRDKFDAIASAREVPRSKPFPDVFLLASERLGIPPGECVVIEDSTAGIRAAKAAGLKSIGFVNPNSKNQDVSEADATSDSMGEISGWLS